MTIYEIKRRVEAANPNDLFFSRNTLKFFKQTLKSFHVRKCRGGRFYIWAPMPCGRTERFFDPATNTLERVDPS